MTLVCAQEADRAALECMAALVADELNVREVVISEDESALVTYEARPNLKLLGPRLGKQLGEVRKELGALTSEQLSVVVAGGSVPSAAVEGLSYDAETLLVDRRSREGLVVAEPLDRIALGLEAEGDLARALDTHWDLIAGEVLATRRLAEAGTDAVAFEVEGSTLRASLVAEV
jgi:hypothetical protein